MVEMLGTLAVMGVLTIGGIAGFNYAMNKQRANATINYVNQVAVLGTGQMLAGNKPKLLDYPKQTPSGYAADITTDDNKPNAFYIEIKGVPAAVCEEITVRQAGWALVNDIGFFDGVLGCSDKETADMWFEITANADKGSAASFSCTSDAECQGLFGKGKCNAHGRCEESCGRAQAISVGCCSKALQMGGGCCRGTLSESDGIRQCCYHYVTDKSYTFCCPAYTFPTDTGECISCDDPRSFVLNLTFQECQRLCPGRTLSGHTCLPAGKTCSDGTILIHNECHCSMDLPIMAADGSCHPADWEGIGVDIPPAGLVNHSDDWGAYYNRRNAGGISYRCPAGKFCSSTGQYTRLIREDGKTVGYSGSYEFDCATFFERNAAELKYQAWCESCGGTWNGSSWDNGTCTP